MIDVLEDATAADPDDLGSELLGVVARLHRWATRNADLAVSPGLARLLAQIEELEPARIGDLARADHCSQPTMTTQVRRLEERGLASRTADETDGRAVLITVTPAGRSLLLETRQARAAVVAPLVDSLGADDRVHLRAAVDIVARLLDTTGAPPEPVAQASPARA